MPCGFLFKKPEPFEQDIQLSVIIPAMVEKSFKNEFRALLNLVSRLKEGLGPKGPCPLAIPRRWCVGTRDIVAVLGTTTLVRRPAEVTS